MKNRIIGPNDPSPRPDQYHDYMNYRGVAVEKECKQLFSGVVSLGRYLQPHGRRGRELFLSSEILKRHCAVIGRTGAGKTEGIVIPWTIGLLKNGYSVVTVDVVGNLVNRLRTETQKLGCRFWYWDSDNPTDSNSWNWLNEIKVSNDSDIEAAIYSLLGRPNPSDPNRFFYERDVRWLRALIKITKEVYLNHAKPRDLYRLVADQDALRDVFRQYPQIRHYDIELADLFRFSPDEHSKAVSGLLNTLSVFNQSSVIQVSERSDFLLSDIDVGPTLLVIGDSQGSQKSTQLTSLAISQLFNHIHRRSRGKVSHRVPLYFMLDEAPRLKDKIDYEGVLAVARNADVGICLSAQDVSQFGDERKAAEILNNCNTIIASKGVAPEAAQYLSRQLGKRREQKLTVTRQRNTFDDWRDIDRGKSLFEVILGNIFSSSNGVDTLEVPVLGEREIMYPPVGRYPAIVLVSPVTNQPFIVDLDTGLRNL